MQHALQHNRQQQQALSTALQSNWGVLQAELELHGVVYTVSTAVHGDELLLVKIEDKDTLDTWHGEFAAKCALCWAARLFVGSNKLAIVMDLCLVLYLLVTVAYCLPLCNKILPLQLQLPNCLPQQSAGKPRQLLPAVC